MIGKASPSWALGSAPKQKVSHTHKQGEGQKNPYKTNPLNPPSSVFLIDPFRFL
jgi:hypothetical protein